MGCSRSDLHGPARSSCASWPGSPKPSNRELENCQASGSGIGDPGVGCVPNRNRAIGDIDIDTDRGPCKSQILGIPNAPPSVPIAVAPSRPLSIAPGATVSATITIDASHASEGVYGDFLLQVSTAGGLHFDYRIPA